MPNQGLSALTSWAHTRWPAPLEPKARHGLKKDGWSRLPFDGRGALAGAAWQKGVARTAASL